MSAKTQTKKKSNRQRASRLTLEDVLEWFENNGFIEGVHFDEASIVAEIKATLAEEAL